jgi:hypothetical protein
MKEGENTSLSPRTCLSFELQAEVGAWTRLHKSPDNISYLRIENCHLASTLFTFLLISSTVLLHPRIWTAPTHKRQNVSTGRVCVVTQAYTPTFPNSNHHRQPEPRPSPMQVALTHASIATWLLKKKNPLPSPRSLARAARYVFHGQILVDTILLCGVGHVLQERLLARKVRPDQRWDESVGARGALPGSSAKKGRSLAVDQPRAGRTFPGDRHDMARAGSRSQAEERLSETAAILKISRRWKPCTEGFLGN